MIVLLQFWPSSLYRFRQFVYPTRDLSPLCILTYLKCVRIKLEVIHSVPDYRLRQVFDSLTSMWSKCWARNFPLYIPVWNKFVRQLLWFCQLMCSFACRCKKCSSLDSPSWWPMSTFRPVFRPCKKFGSVTRRTPHRLLGHRPLYISAWTIVMMFFLWISKPLSVRPFCSILSWFAHNPNRWSSSASKIIDWPKIKIVNLLLFHSRAMSILSHILRDLYRVSNGGHFLIHFKFAWLRPRFPPFTRCMWNVKTTWKSAVLASRLHNAGRRAFTRKQQKRKLCFSVLLTDTKFFRQNLERAWQQAMLETACLFQLYLTLFTCLSLCNKKIFDHLKGALHSEIM